MLKQQQQLFKDYLKIRGLRFTPERQVILEGVFSVSGHFDVENLYKRLHRKAGEISLATVYRAIPHLIESGLIKEVLRCQDRPQYERVLGKAHHDHLICLSCGKIFEFQDNEIEELQSKACKRFGFQSTEHLLAVRGFCKDCRDRKNKKK